MENNYNLYHYFYYLLMRFFVKIYHNKGNPFMAAFQLLNYCLISHIGIILILVGVPSIERKQMYLFAALIILPIYLFNWYIFLKQDKYRKILMYYNKNYIHERKIYFERFSLIYVLSSFVSLAIVLYIKLKWPTTLFWRKYK